MEFDDLSNRVIGCAIEVHRELGPGLLESTYEQCLARELRLHGIPFQLQHPQPAEYKGICLDCGYRIDMLIEDELIIELMVLMRARYRVPGDPKAQNLARRFDEHGEDYLRFLTTPGLEPTNNIAERAIRFVVIDRRVTQGSKSEKGQCWLERIWTLIATREQRDVSLFNCLREAVKRHLAGEPPPSLLPVA